MIPITTLLFYIFSAVLLSSAGMVVTSRNTVHGVLFLIVTFFNAAALFIIANAEFLAMILIVVYVGAVAVLFLFIVMMLNVESRPLRKSFKPYWIIGSFVGGILLAELILLTIGWTTSPVAFELSSPPPSNPIPNTQALGNLLFTHYLLSFQGAGLILLISMVGAIVLTFRQREGVRKQKVHTQLNRQAKDSIRLENLPIGLERKETPDVH